jgi:hypothetical protein
MQCCIQQVVGETDEIIVLCSLIFAFFMETAGSKLHERDHTRNVNLFSVSPECNFYLLLSF